MGRMNRPASLEIDLAIARSRAAQYVPFSPAWDAAMGHVDDLEGWRTDDAPEEALLPSDRSLVPVSSRSGPIRGS